jgi:anthranilate phosphoribosyltransferase
VLEALGIPLEVPPARQGEVLRTVNIAFLFAPAHHPAMRHGGVARRELAIRTVFNALGPIANPARATHQLLGTYDDALRAVLAHTLAELGTRRAWVVRGEDGLDELSPFTATRVAVLASGSVTERTVTPEDFGLSRSPAGALAGGDAGQNAAAIDAILRGEPHPARTAVVLNAAAALAVAREIDDADGFRACAGDATRALDEGGAQETLDRWRRAARAAMSDGGEGSASGS